MWTDNPYATDSPQSAFPAGLQASFVVPGQVRVYGFTVYSSKASSQFIQVFDLSALPADATVPIFPLPVNANSQVSAYYGPMGRVFHQGLVLCNSSTATTKTLGSVDCFFDVQYDNLLAGS